MILYVNGDSHAAAAECVNSHAWAQDDGMYWGLGQRPHPDNERASFGCELANSLNAVLICDAQAGGSNARILRTTRCWIQNNQSQLSDTLILIQWSTWEREEWLWADQWWQVNASGTDHVPEALQSKYKQYILDLDWNQKAQEAHDQIWEFHLELLQKHVPHLFFNGNNDFGQIPNRQDWGSHYLCPYESNMTYDAILRENGFKTVNPESWHFGPDAHCFWATYVLQYMIDANLIAQ